MAVRAQFENSNEVGVFAKLTNTYCLVGIGGSENFYRFVYLKISNKIGIAVLLEPFLFCSVFEGELQDVIPVVHTQINGCRIIGRMTVGTFFVLVFYVFVFFLFCFVLYSSLNLLTVHLWL